MEVALHGSTNLSGCLKKKMQQSERVQGKAVQSETGFISDFKRKGSQQKSQYTHAITLKSL